MKMDFTLTIELENAYKIDLVPWDQLPPNQLHQINLAQDQLPWDQLQQDQLNFYNTWTLIGECNLPNQLGVDLVQVDLEGRYLIDVADIHGTYETRP